MHSKGIRPVSKTSEATEREKLAWSLVFFVACLLVVAVWS